MRRPSPVDAHVSSRPGWTPRQGCGNGRSQEHRQPCREAFLGRLLTQGSGSFTQVVSVTMLDQLVEQFGGRPAE